MLTRTSYDSHISIYKCSILHHSSKLAPATLLQCSEISHHYKISTSPESHCHISGWDRLGHVSKASPFILHRRWDSCHKVPFSIQNEEENIRLDAEQLLTCDEFQPDFFLNHIRRLRRVYISCRGGFERTGRTGYKECLFDIEEVPLLLSDLCGLIIAENMIFVLQSEDSWFQVSQNWDYWRPGQYSILPMEELVPFPEQGFGSIDVNDPYVCSFKVFLFRKYLSTGCLYCPFSTSAFPFRFM